MGVDEHGVHHDSLVRRLRREHPEASWRGPRALDEFVVEGVANAGSLGFTEEQDIYRLMVLPLVLSTTQRNSMMLNGLIVRALDQTRWTPSHRLDFIYEQLVPRTPSPTSEADLADLYTPPGENDDEPERA